MKFRKRRIRRFRRTGRRIMRPRRPLKRRFQANRLYFKKTFFLDIQSTSYVNGIGFICGTTLAPGTALANALVYTPQARSYERVRLRGYKLSCDGFPRIDVLTMVGNHAVQVDLNGTPPAFVASSTYTPQTTTASPGTRTARGDRRVSGYHNTRQAIKMAGESDMWFKLDDNGAVVAYPFTSIGGLRYCYFAGNVSGTIPAGSVLTGNERIKVKVTVYLELSGLRRTLQGEVN